MPTARRDRFSLREKVAALARLAEGQTYRSAAAHSRDRATQFGRRHGVRIEVSRDGRLTADWVSQYAPILAKEYLPTRWPEVLVLDHLPFHLKDHSQGAPKPSGRAVVDEKTFTRRARYEALLAELDFLHRDGWFHLEPARRDVVNRFAGWLDEVEEDVRFGLEHAHEPWTTGGLEKPLRLVKNALYDRRKVLRNMARLNHLLMLLQLQQMGRASEKEWTEVLRRQHLRHDGNPPPRREVDDPALRPR